MKHGALFFLGTGTLSLVLAASAIGGCQSDTTGSGAGVTTTTSETGGAGTTTSGTNTGGTGSTTSTTGTGGTGPAVVDAVISDITTGKVGKGIVVSLKGVVAMSPKFKVSGPGSTGSCLWGVFVSAPGIATTGPDTGILLTEYGTMAMIPEGGTEAFCPVIQADQASGGLIPDDVKPGDVLDVVGKSDNFLSSSCSGQAGATGAGQFQISQLSSATRTGTAPVPALYELKSEDVMLLAGNQDKAFLSAWGGVKVRVTGGTAIPQNGKITDTYGHIFLDNGVNFGDKIYYAGFVAKKNVCYAGPAYMNASQAFTSVDGFVYLDFCTWNLQPNNKCHDIVPPSEDCGTTGTADKVCTE